MKSLVILGAGTGGTMAAHKLSSRLNLNEWRITIVDPDPIHYYQPGFLFIPFGIYEPEDVIKPRSVLLPHEVNYVQATVERVDPKECLVYLSGDREPLPYDQLIIATGTKIAPTETPGLLDSGGWLKNIFDFYTIQGATALGHHLQNFNEGRLVVNVTEMPIKCPVAPLEFLFLADWHFRIRGIRDRVELVYATPLPSVFTKAHTAEIMGEALHEKGIKTEVDFNIAQADAEAKVIRSYDDREVPFDLLVTIPTNMGADYVGASGLGDELNYVRTDKYTLQAKDAENIWVIGDAGNLPASKAGSVAHFMLDVLAENFEAAIHGRQLPASFDGHANCFIESGFGKAYLIDFNYDVEPLPGTYPLPVAGQFSLLRETRMNHLGKLAFKWVYWNILIKGLPMPVSNHLSLIGKQHVEHVN